MAAHAAVASEPQCARRCDLTQSAQLRDPRRLACCALAVTLPCIAIGPAVDYCSCCDAMLSGRELSDHQLYYPFSKVVLEVKTVSISTTVLQYAGGSENGNTSQAKRECNISQAEEIGNTRQGKMQHKPSRGKGQPKNQAPVRGRALRGTSPSPVTRHSSSSY